MKLRQPFEKTLKEKQRGMNLALEGFGKLVNYEVGEVTAAATYYMAEVYADFGRSLLESERPAGLKEAALQKYNDQLEEEAFPFEEKAIKFHEKNLELMASAYHAITVDREESRATRHADARSLCEVGDQHRLPGIDRPLRIPQAGDPMQ